MYRITKTKRGFAIEIKCAKWTLFGIKYNWSICSFYRGTSEPFYFITKESAMNSLLTDVKFSTIENS